MTLRSTLALGAAAAAALTCLASAAEARPAGRGFGPSPVRFAGARRPGGFGRHGFHRGGFAGYGFGYGGILPSAYGSTLGEAGAGSFVDASVRTYPSPSELVPPAWSYGTYGIPTVPGVASPPVGNPVVYRIEGGRSAARPSARVLSRGEDVGWQGAGSSSNAGGARVVTVTVPNR